MQIFQKYITKKRKESGQPTLQTKPRRNNYIIEDEKQRGKEEAVAM